MGFIPLEMNASPALLPVKPALTQLYVFLVQPSIRFNTTICLSTTPVLAPALTNTSFQVVTALLASRLAGYVLRKLPA